MIVVTGANGQLGRAVVEALLKRVPATRVAVSVRDAEKARDLQERGVRVRQGDFTHPEALRWAWEGAHRVLIVSSNTHGHDAVGQHRAAIEAARAVGMKRIFYTSHVGASPTSPFAPMVDHAATEAALAEAGIPSTVVRNGFYATTVPLMIRRSLATGTIALPADGPVSWTTHADLAEAIAILLTTEGPQGSTTVNLTASEALDFQGVARLVSKLARRVDRQTLTDEAFVEAMVSQGQLRAVAEVGLGIFRASRQGQFALVDPTLATLLGRTPTSLEDYLRSERSSLRDR